jgi:hypothetical protein
MLAKVLTVAIFVECLCWFGLNEQLRHFDCTLMRWWICGLVGGVALQGYWRRQGALYLR